MVYQPLYVKVSDNQGFCRSTSSLRGRVDQVGVWLNSWLGTVLRVDASFVDGKSVVSRPDLRKVKKELRAEVLEKYNAEVHAETRVILDFDVEADERFEIRLNGVPLSYERVRLLKDLQLQRFNQQIDLLGKMQKEDGEVLQVTQLVNQ